MKSQKQRSHVGKSDALEESRDGITIRSCHGIEEFEACVSVERQVWKSQDIDVVPIPLFVVAA